VATGQACTVQDLENISARMRRMEDKYRALIDNVDVGICIAKMKFDSDNRAIDYLIVEGNEAYERHTGLHGSVGRWVSDFAPDLERHWFDTYGEVALTGNSVKFENEAMPLGNRWFQVEAHRVGAPEDREVAILFTDITARRRDKEQQQIVTRELAHRMKNFVAIVQSMVSQTLRHATSIEEAYDAINGRLVAFARAQDLLGPENIDSADIVAVVMSALLPHQTEDERIRMVGPTFELSSRRVLGLSLTLHELATNSIKYGALSCDTGTITLQWEVTDQGLQLIWTEQGGPSVEKPLGRGFGSRLIETVTQSSFGGTSNLAFEQTGVRFTLNAPPEPW
jgi:two-component sensor histidine kinase